MKSNVKNEDVNLYEKYNQIKKDKLKSEMLLAKSKRKLSLIICIVIILFLSISNMFSSTLDTISRNGYKLFWRHIVYIIVSVFVFIIASKINYKIYKKKVVVSFLLLFSIAVLLFILNSKNQNIVPVINDAKEWIRIGGIQVQPSEFFKLVYVIILSCLLGNLDEEGLEYSPMTSFYYVCPIYVTFAILIYMQNDLGTVIHYTLITFFMVFMSKIKDKIMSTLIIAFLFLSTISITFFYKYGESIWSGYKYRRVESFIQGILYNTYDQNIGYQVNQSLIAFGHGGVFGKGYANGLQKYSYIPEINTDFILSTFGEEFGFLGMLIIIVLFFVLFAIISKTAMECKDYFGKYLAMGIGGFIITQVLINIYVVIGLLPVFGLPLPLISYGGSSILTIMFSLGIIYNINNS